MGVNWLSTFINVHALTHDAPPCAYPYYPSNYTINNHTTPKTTADEVSQHVLELCSLVPALMMPVAQPDGTLSMTAADLAAQERPLATPREALLGESDDLFAVDGQMMKLINSLEPHIDSYDVDKVTSSRATAVFAYLFATPFVLCCDDICVHNRLMQALRF